VSTGDEKHETIPRRAMYIPPLFREEGGCPREGGVYMATEVGGRERDVCMRAEVLGWEGAHFFSLPNMREWVG
jgi:hypothetical protein